jgi:hypothetical protein
VCVKISCGSVLGYLPMVLEMYGMLYVSTLSCMPSRCRLCSRSIEFLISSWYWVRILAAAAFFSFSRRAGSLGCECINSQNIKKTEGEFDPATSRYQPDAFQRCRGIFCDTDTTDIRMTINPTFECLNSTLRRHRPGHFF